jgi:hypothetical protein
MGTVSANLRAGNQHLKAEMGFNLALVSQRIAEASSPPRTADECVGLFIDFRKKAA